MPLNPRIQDWKGQRVWLIGASSGIGRASAAALHARGASVVVSARNLAALDDFAQQHPGSQAVAMDVTDRAQVRHVAQHLLATGPLHLVCYCAGTYRPMRATDMNLDEMLHHNSVNYNGVLHVLDAVLPALLAQARQKQPAHLSVISSVAGFRGLPQSLAYGPTKAALIHLAETGFVAQSPPQHW